MKPLLFEKFDIKGWNVSNCLKSNISKLQVSNNFQELLSNCILFKFFLWNHQMNRSLNIYSSTYSNNKQIPPLSIKKLYSAVMTIEAFDAFYDTK